MTAKRTFFTFILSTFLFTVLFYKQVLGLNLFLFEGAVLLWLLGSKEIPLKPFNVASVFLAVIVSAVFSVIHHTNLSLTVNVLCFFLFIGVICAPEINSLWNSLLTSFSSLFSAFSKLRIPLFGSSARNKKMGFNLRRNLLLFAPLMIIVVFIIIYGIANPKFGELVNWVLEFISDGFSTFFGALNLNMMGVIFLGALVSLFIFVRSRNERIAKKDGKSTDELHRIKKRRYAQFSPIGLINEYRSAVFLFATLNFLLLVLNVLDLNYVWFNFKWEGQYLKDFVHNGVYVLIFAILISLLLVLYVFRENLNFYKKGKWLKRLCYFWLIQNFILSISVGVRNWYYIDYYALADRRIAIFFFLLLVIFTLLTVYVKVKHTKSRYYFLRKNAYALMVVLVVSTFFNWDRIIASYNFSHAKKSFIHLNYLVKLSDSALPFLDQPLDKLVGADEYQKKSFFKVSFSGSSMESYSRMYITPEEYVKSINQRKKQFMTDWENKSWLEWNYAEHLAYRALAQ